MFPPVTYHSCSDRYYDSLNKSRGLISVAEREEKEKAETHAKLKKAVSECAVVAVGVGMIYFGMKRSIRVEAERKIAKQFENRLKMEKPVPMLPTIK